MKEEYYLSYRTSKGDENPADEAILFGNLTPKILDGLKFDIKERNAVDDVGELFLDKKRNDSLSEKKRLWMQVLSHDWNRSLGRGNPALSELKNPDCFAL